MKKLLILFLISCPTFLLAQSEIDSLLQVVASTENDSIKIETYFRLSYQYYRTDQNLTLEYATKSEELALETDMILSIGRAKLLKGSMLSSFNWFDQSELKLKEARDIFLKLNDKKRLTHVNIELGVLYMNQSKHEDAIGLFIESLSFCRESDDNNEEARIHNYLGSIFHELKQYDKAIEHYKLALVLVEELDFKIGISVCLTNLGAIYIKINETETAEVYLNKALTIKTEINDKIGACRVLINLALIKLNVEDYDEAKILYQKAFIYAEEVNYPQDLLIINNGLARIAFYQEEYEKCLDYSKKIIESPFLSEQSIILAETYNIMSKAYHELKDFENAYISSIKFNSVQDSLYNLDILSVTNDLESKYKNEKSAKEIELLKSKNEIIEVQKNNQRNILLGGLGLSILTGLFFFIQFKNRKRINKKLKDLSKAKSIFFANISHEFRTPLTLISGPIEKQLKKENLQNEERSNLEMMQRNSNRLLSLVNQLLDISKIESDSMQLKVSKSDVEAFVKIMVEGFAFNARQHQVQLLNKVVSGKIETWFDKDILEKILANLLSNAIKYTPPQGEIECKTIVTKDTFLFEIRNTGKGLSEQQVNKIFERFYQVNEDKNGIGIGLALVKELVTLHKGSITATSTLNEWTSFTVSIPINKSSYTPSEFSQGKSLNSNDNSVIQSRLAKNPKMEDLDNVNDEKAILLIVDDNEDIRNYIHNIFRDSYHILEAENGQIGIDIAIEHIPNIIISDIMMPVKDGIELSNHLKTDERTSHIPIILLTAKVGEENELIGIETGADDYITKPFSEDLLKLKVNKRLENLKKLQERYSQEIILKPKDISVNSADQTFLERVQLVLDNKIIESTFSIQEFSDFVGMSRMQLHRKLKALTGLSTSEFIRTERLKLATQLLVKSDINVSQIAYSVGFNDHAYFSKSFKEMFNCTPTEYMKNQNNLGT